VSGHVVTAVSSSDITVRRATTRELPNNTPYVAKLGFIRDFQRDWPAHTRVLVETIHQALHATVSDLLHETFGPYVHLESRVR
jgi:hypothetical protein